MKTIAVINQKGGVGKTAIAYNVASEIAHMTEKTLLVDLDPSANATKGLGFYDYDHYVGNLFEGNRNFPIDVCAYNIDSYLWLIPSKINLALVQRSLASKSFRESILKKQLKKFAMDICIIDCSPTLSDLTINAIYAADLILIPVTYGSDALEGMADLFSVIDEIKEGQDYQWKIVLNGRDCRKKRTNEYIDRKISEFLTTGNLMKTIIRQDELINQAKIESQTIFQYAPKSTGSQDLKQLSEELLACLR
jgi:chromosome partitioning protein